MRCRMRNEKIGINRIDNPQSTIRNPQSAVLRMTIEGATPRRSRRPGDVARQKNYFTATIRRSGRPASLTSEGQYDRLRGCRLITTETRQIEYDGWAPCRPQSQVSFEGASGLASMRAATYLRTTADGSSAQTCLSGEGDGRMRKWQAVHEQGALNRL